MSGVLAGPPVGAVLFDYGLTLVTYRRPEAALERAHERISRLLAARLGVAVPEGARLLTAVHDVVEAAVEAHELGGGLEEIDLEPLAEARMVCEAAGCATTTAVDVGVAGLERLFAPLGAMLGAGADALVVAAGMDGALASVVAGLAGVPVIGLPVSTGYGAGGRGRAALLSMLQGCAPGLVVVNIDNGVGAGAAAALMARRSGEPWVG
ncbi:MAG TPA: AIR carboxylase family protein [Candidatus Dormibacteraeota bacterium]